MTNADVPALAMEGIVASPVNPFTGNPINTDAKNDPVQYVFGSLEWEFAAHSGNTFTEDYWIQAGKTVWDPDNWTFSEGKSSLPEFE